MKEEKIQRLYDQVMNEEEIFLNYLRSIFPFFHKSNFFVRDLEYGIKSFFEKKNIKTTISETTALANRIGRKFEEKNYFRRTGDGVWTVNLPQYVTTKPGDPF